jgi:hypothetical protein
VYAVFFLSSGRCGTQWIADSLQKYYAGQIRAVHEPLPTGYHPREFFGLRDPARLSDNGKFLAHADSIERSLLAMGATPPLPYAEVGWPCFAAIPYFAERFRGRVRIVHLVRHPVLSASSLLTHGLYDVDRPGTIGENTLLTPFDAGIAFPRFKDVWAQLSGFEKCLYFWAEINNHGLKLESRGQTPWLRIKFEDIFQADQSGLVRLLEFLGLQARNEIIEALNSNVDAYRFRSFEDWQADQISKHPEITGVAEALGYDASGVDQGIINERYRLPERARAAAKAVGTADGRLLYKDDPASFAKAGAKARRNDPCPCGSGKKFKHCHGAPGA